MQFIYITTIQYHEYIQYTVTYKNKHEKKHIYSN